MTDRRQDPSDDDDLELYFAAARRETPAPSAAFMARVLADAAAAQARMGPARLGPARLGDDRAAVVAGPGGIWAQLRAMLGGWPAQGGLVAAGLTGLALGLAAPTAPAVLGDLAALALGQPADTYLVDLGPGLDFDIAMDLNGG